MNEAARAYFDRGILSQSFLARADLCRHSGLLYAIHRGARVQSHAMARGEVFHDFAEQAVKQMLADGEETMPPDVGRELVEAICDARELTVPAHERDVLRGMAWNWCEATRVDLAHPPATEIEISFPLGNWTLTGRIDWLAVYDGSDAYVKDYKTSLSMPSQERFEQGFQGPLYGLAIVERNPKIERVHYAEEYPRLSSKRCPACGMFNDADAGSCKECEGREFEPPTLGRRRITFAKRDLHDFRRSVTSLLADVERHLDSEVWPATPGPHCSVCPAQSQCPLLEDHRPPAVETHEDAARVLGIAERHKKAAKRHTEAARAYASEHGPIPDYAFKNVITTRDDKLVMSQRFGREAA